MSTFPTFSQQSRVARALIYSPYNDVTVFVEDESMEHLHLTLLHRLLGSSVRIEQVFGLGGKQPVLAAYQQHKDGPGIVSGACVFILDRDLDDYLGISPIQDQILIYLDEYCIENYLAEETGTLKTIQWKVHEELATLKTRVAFHNWRASTASAFLELFAAFVIARRYNLGPSVGLGPYRFLSDLGGYTVNQLQVAAYITNIREGYKSQTGQTDEAFDLELNTIRTHMWDSVAPNMTAAISGKFLLASLRRYASSLCSFTFDEQLFIGLLANSCDLASLAFVRQRILNVIDASA